MIESLRFPLRNPAARSLLIAAGFLLLVLVLIFGLQGDGPAAGETTGLAAQSFPVLASLAFAGGIFSFVFPCTSPILPAYFAFASQSGRSQIALNTVVYMLGVATMFSLLGASASALGRVLLQNQQLLLLVGGTLVMGFGVMALLGKGFTEMSQSNYRAVAPTL